MLGLEAVERLRTQRGRALYDAIDGVQQPVDVPGAQRGVLAGLEQPVGGVSADRLEQPVAHRGRLRAAAARPRHLNRDERLVDQAREQVEHLAGLEAGSCAHCLGGLQGPAARKDRGPAEHRLLRLAKEVVAPVNGGAECPVARERGAGAAGEQPEAVLDAGEELLHGEHARARRGELERERHAV